MASKRVHVIAEKSTSADEEDFSSALDVWIKRPHVVNKKVLGATILESPREWLEGEGELVTELVTMADACVETSCLVRELIPRSRDTRDREVVVLSKFVGKLLKLKFN